MPVVRTTVSLALIGAVLATGYVPAAHAQAPSLENTAARARLDKALELYAQKKYSAAAAEIEAAYNIEPRPELLYMWAQSKRLDGDCRAAIALYGRFLATSPSGEEAERARKNIARCQAQVSSPESPGPAPGATPADAAAATTTPAGAASAPPGAVQGQRPPAAAVTAPEAPVAAEGPAVEPGHGPSATVVTVLRPSEGQGGGGPRSLAPGVTLGGASPARPQGVRASWTQDSVGHALVMGAVVTGIGASGLYFWALNEREVAGAARVYQDVVDHAESAKIRRNFAYAAAGLATALLVAGIVAYIRD